jgi:hypothetical protein
MNYSRQTCFACGKLYCKFDDIYMCVISMLSYIPLELNFLLYNVPVLEAPIQGGSRNRLY